MSFIEEVRKRSEENRSEYFNKLVNESINLATQKIRITSSHKGIFDNESIYLGEQDYASAVFRRKYTDSHLGYCEKTINEKVIEAVGDHFRREGFTVTDDHRTISWK